MYVCKQVKHYLTVGVIKRTSRFICKYYIRFVDYRTHYTCSLCFSAGYL